MKMQGVLWRVKIFLKSFNLPERDSVDFSEKIVYNSLYAIRKGERYAAGKIHRTDEAPIGR